MSVRRISLTVRIGDEWVPARTVRTVHDVDTPVGTASITMPAPRPVHVTRGASVTIHADGLPIFSGTVAEDDAIFDDGGGEVRVECEGHARRLFYRVYQDLGYTGPMRLDRLFRNLCSWRGVPFYYADTATAPDGLPLMLGSNPDIDGGWIPMDAGSSPASLLSRACKLFGYKFFDTPTGWTRLRNLTGLPRTSIDDLPLFEEGVDFLSISRSSTWDGIANYWEALGAEYQAADTSEVSIRNIPATVTLDTMRYGPDGVNRATIGRDQMLVTDELARAARQAHEINYSTDQHRWRWQVTGRANYQPGGEVALISPTVNGVRGGSVTESLIGALPRAMWIMRVEHSISDTGWLTTMEGWAGAGQAIPAGDDCISQPLLGADGLHMGTEYLGHYRRPSADGVQIDIPFEVDSDYSTLTIRGWGHGINNFQGNTATSASRFEIWQTHVQTDRAVASGEMPRMDENLEQQLPYGERDGEGNYTGAHWQPLVIPLTGSLKAGTAILRIISGYDNTVGDYDDYEVRDIVATFCGVGEPEVE